MENGFELVKPGDEQWDSARAAFNLAIDQVPAMVRGPETQTRLPQSCFAREHGLRVAVQAEGHGAGPLAGWARTRSC